MLSGARAFLQPSAPHFLCQVFHGHALLHFRRVILAVFVSTISSTASLDTPLHHACSPPSWEAPELVLLEGAACSQLLPNQGHLTKG